MLLFVLLQYNPIYAHEARMKQGMLFGLFRRTPGARFTRDQRSQTQVAVPLPFEDVEATEMLAMEEVSVAPGLCRKSRFSG